MPVKGIGIPVVKWKGFIYLSSIPGGFAAVRSFVVYVKNMVLYWEGEIMLELLTGNEAVARGLMRREFILPLLTRAPQARKYLKPLRNTMKLSPVVT